MKIIFTCAFIFLMSGCARIEIIETGEGYGNNLIASNPNEIFIYRSQRPQWGYKEIGLVSVNGMNDINQIYSGIRKQSALKGASGVIDFDIESEEVVSTSTSTSCTPQTGCITTTTTSITIVYTASGTLISKLSEIQTDE